MPLALDIDGAAWRAALGDFAASRPGLVPVIKGNGYGFGRARLAAEATRLGVGAVAVSDPEEVAEVRTGFAGDVLVMTPWRAHQDGATNVEDPHVLRSVGHLDALEVLAGREDAVVVECLTSMRRHGLSVAEFEGAIPLLRQVRLQAFALHLPLSRVSRGGPTPVGEVDAWVTRIREADLPMSSLYVSHLSGPELADLTTRHPDVSFRPRIGTALWLGRRELTRPRATVLDVRPLRAGERYGYRQFQARHDCALLVLSGGTAHGIGLEAPVAASGLVRRGKLLVNGAMEAGGRYLSPYVIGGRRRWYAEPPHMQVSMVLLPARVSAPAVGDEVALEVRMTTTTFDVVRGLD